MKSGKEVRMYGFQFLYVIILSFDILNRNNYIGENQCGNSHVRKGGSAHTSGFSFSNSFHLDARDATRRVGSAGRRFSAGFRRRVSCERVGGSNVNFKRIRESRRGFGI